MPQNQIEVIQKIERTLSSGKPMSLHRLSKKTRLHYTTVRRYINLIENVKNMPDIDVIRSDKTTLVRMGRGLLSLPEEEQNKIIKSHFPKLENDTEFLIELSERGAISKNKAIKVRQNGLVKKLLKQGQLRETEGGKVFLTNLGYGIVIGAKKIYSS